MDICFYHYCPGAKQQKKSLVKGFFYFFNCPGRKAGYLGWSAEVPEKLVKEKSERVPRGEGRSEAAEVRESPVKKLQAEQLPRAGRGKLPKLGEAPQLLLSLNSC